MRVVVGVHGADDAGKGFGKRCRVKTRSVIYQQTVLNKHILRDDDVGGIPADIGITVTRRTQYPHRPFRIINRRLNRVLLSRTVPVLPVFSYLQNLSGKFMSDDYRVLCHVIGNPLVVSALVSGLVRRHADAVGDYFGEDFIIMDLRKFKLLEPEVFLTVQSDRFGVHMDLFYDCHDFIISMSGAGVPAHDKSPGSTGGYGHLACSGTDLSGIEMNVIFRR